MVTAPDLVGVDLHGDVGELQHRGVTVRIPGPTQDGAHTCHELFHAEGFGDVVVAQGQAFDLVLRGVACGEEDDGYLVTLQPQPSADLVAVDVGQHHVEHDEVGPEGTG